MSKRACVLASVYVIACVCVRAVKGGDHVHACMFVFVYVCAFV